MRRYRLFQGTRVAAEHRYHRPVPSFRLRETGLLAFVNVGGGKHFVELTQPPADPARRTRKFWYTRLLRL